MNGPNDINAQFGRLASWSSLRALRNCNRGKEVSSPDCRVKKKKKKEPPNVDTSFQKYKT